MFRGIMILTVITLNLSNFNLSHCQTDVVELSHNSISTQNEKKDNDQIFKRWQIRAGYSINNDSVATLEGSYVIPLSHLFAVSIDARIYSFFSITPFLTTRPIKIYDKFSFSAQGGIGIRAFGVGFGGSIGDITAELGATIRYKLNDKMNFILNYKQISSSSHYPTFSTLFPPKVKIDNFPIRFITIGIEL